MTNWNRRDRRHTTFHRHYFHAIRWSGGPGPFLFGLAPPEALCAWAHRPAMLCITTGSAQNSAEIFLGRPLFVSYSRLEETGGLRWRRPKTAIRNKPRPQGARVAATPRGASYISLRSFRSTADGDSLWAKNHLGPPYFSAKQSPSARLGDSFYFAKCEIVNRS